MTLKWVYNPGVPVKPHECFEAAVGKQEVIPTEQIAPRSILECDECGELWYARPLSTPDNFYWVRFSKMGTFEKWWVMRRATAS